MCMCVCVCVCVMWDNHSVNHSVTVMFSCTTGNPITAVYAIPASRTGYSEYMASTPPTSYHSPSWMSYPPEPEDVPPQWAESVRQPHHPEAPLSRRPPESCFLAQDNLGIFCRYVLLYIKARVGSFTEKRFFVIFVKIIFAA